MKKRLVCFTGICLFISGCASTPSTTVSSVPALTLFYSHARYGALTPCGCEIAPQGGVVREWNLIEQWKKTTHAKKLYLVGGTTLVPRLIAPAENSTLRKKAAYTVEALNALGANVFSPSLEDVGLGAEALRALEKKSKFEWVSCHLRGSDGKLLFKPYVQYEWEGYPFSIFITGVSAHADAAAALRELLDELPKKARFVIVISSLNASERISLKKAVPEINLILGGAEERYEAREQLGASTFFLEPIAEGRGLVRLDLQFRTKKLTLFNPEVAYLYHREMEEKKSRIAMLEEKLGTRLPQKKRNEVSRQKNELLGEIRELSSVNFDNLNDGIIYDYRFEILNKTYDTPSNPMSPLVERYQQEFAIR